MRVWLSDFAIGNVDRLRLCWIRIRASSLARVSLVPPHADTVCAHRQIVPSESIDDEVSGRVCVRFLHDGSMCVWASLARNVPDSRAPVAHISLRHAGCRWRDRRCVISL